MRKSSIFIHQGLRRLNQFHNKIYNLISLNEKLVRLFQISQSVPTADNLRFPLYALEIGTKKAIKEHPVALVAGVHGLETIGISILLDSLFYMLQKNSSGYLPQISQGKIGIIVLPIVNPGGVAIWSRSNPHGVDLMRNSGWNAETALPFFGGQRWSPHLPYYRGDCIEKETRALYKFVISYLFQQKETIVPVVDIHSGFGVRNRVWWPYARSKKECRDHALYEHIAAHLKDERGHDEHIFEKQSDSYTVHGDLWDRLYAYYQKRTERFHLKRSSRRKNKEAARFLPFTLEIGTWHELTPWRMLKKKRIFNPPQNIRRIVIESQRTFLRDFVLLAAQGRDFFRYYQNLHSEKIVSDQPDQPEQKKNNKDSLKIISSLKHRCF